jgi:hypothetical protein
MANSRRKKVPLQTQLGLLAMRFRSTRDEVERAGIAATYGQVVVDLIESGRWKEMPAFEDMLPDERMPEVFFSFWSIPSPFGQEGPGRKNRRAE